MEIQITLCSQWLPYWMGQPCRPSCRNVEKQHPGGFWMLCLVPGTLSAALRGRGSGPYSVDRAAELREAACFR